MNSRRAEKAILLLICLTVAAYFFYRNLGSDGSGAWKARASWAKPALLKSPRPVSMTREFVNDVDVVALTQTLQGFRPLAERGRIETGIVLHALRLWGKDAEFDTTPFQDGKTGDRQAVPSKELLDFCLDNRVFRAKAPRSEKMLIPTVYGVSVRPMPMEWDSTRNVFPGYEPHVDKIVSVLGEIGIASNYPICWRGDHGDVNGLVSDMLSDSLMRFSPDQELEFTAKAFLYYLPGGSRWKNRLGDEWSLSAILERLASRNPNEGCCAGTHRLHVFALALNLDRAEPFLSPDLRSLLHLKLREASELLRDTQEKDGCWSTGWFGPGWPARDLGEPALASHLRVVGHHLEWFALSEEGDRPPRETIRSAMAYTQRSLASIDSLFIYQYYPPLSHAVRGLVLLSGQAPTSLDSRGPSKRIEGD